MASHVHESWVCGVVVCACVYRRVIGLRAMVASKASRCIRLPKPAAEIVAGELEKDVDMEDRLNGQRVCQGACMICFFAARV